MTDKQHVLLMFASCTLVIATWGAFLAGEVAVAVFNIIGILLTGVALFLMDNADEELK